MDSAGSALATPSPLGPSSVLAAPQQPSSSPAPTSPAVTQAAARVPQVRGVTLFVAEIPIELREKDFIKTFSSCEGFLSARLRFDRYDKYAPFLFQKGKNGQENK